LAVRNDVARLRAFGGFLFQPHAHRIDHLLLGIVGAPDDEMRMDVVDAAVPEAHEATCAQIRLRKGLPHQRHALARDSGIHDKTRIGIDRSRGGLVQIDPCRLEKRLPRLRKVAQQQAFVEVAQPALSRPGQPPGP
jgi:hypothetical protein